MTDVAARAVRMPFTFYFAASIIYLLITIVSLQLFQQAEAWANRGIRRADDGPVGDPRQPAALRERPGSRCS